MAQVEALPTKETGVSLVELVTVLAGAVIILVAAVPMLTTVRDQYGLVLAAQGVSTQLHYARMKAVASNESLQVSFPAYQNTYQVETSTGEVIAGPFFLPNGINWEANCSEPEVSFPGRYIIFSPTGNIPAGGNGSAGRVKLRNRSGYRIDVVVSSGGMIRQTPTYTGCPPPF